MVISAYQWYIFAHHNLWLILFLYHKWNEYIFSTLGACSSKGRIVILGQIVSTSGQMFRSDFCPQDEIFRPGMPFRPLDEQALSHVHQNGWDSMGWGHLKPQICDFSRHMKGWTYLDFLFTGNFFIANATKWIGPILFIFAPLLLAAGN